MLTWRRFISLLVLVLMLTPLSPSVAEEDTGEGTVRVIDHTQEELLREIISVPTAPFIPDSAEDEPDPETAEEEQPRTVFGSDDRVTVKNTSEFPYSAIAYMTIKAKCGCNWTGSGFMVDRNKLLTAAHCLVCWKHNQWANKITFYFGYKKSGKYKYRYNGKWEAYAGNLFRDREYTINWDYGCVKLNKNVGDKVGWFGTWWAMSDSQISSKYLYVAGYADGVLRYDSGFAEAAGQQHITYRMDTVPGNSGGPVFTYDYYAVGINIAYSNYNNTGYRLTTTVKNDLDGLH